MSSETNSHNDSHSTRLEELVKRALSIIDENPSRCGLSETPKRVSKACGEWFKGYHTDPTQFIKLFEESYQSPQMVCQYNIPVWSHCEHHIAPFFGVAHIGYIPDGKILGLSKFSRIVDAYSRRLQVQERLTNQVADLLFTGLNPIGVGVVLHCRHLCMESRGVQVHGSFTSTSALRGDFNYPDVKAEFSSLVQTHARTSF